MSQTRASPSSMPETRRVLPGAKARERTASSGMLKVSSSLPSRADQIVKRLPTLAVDNGMKYVASRRLSDDMASSHGLPLSKLLDHSSFACCRSITESD